MGGSQSSQNNDGRRRQNGQAPPQPPPPNYQTQPYAPPPVYPTGMGQYPPVMMQNTPSYYGAPPPPQPYQAVYRPPVPMPMQQQQPYMQNQYGQPPRPPVPTQECQTTATIRNQVNLKKPTLALALTGQPGVFNITFSFDASAPCRVTTFVCAHEDVRRACKITSPFPPAPAISFPKGLNHKFSAATPGGASHVVNTVRASARDLTSVSNDTFPVIIRLEAVLEDPTPAGAAGSSADGARMLEGLEAGCELPQWVQSQTTYAKLTKEDDGSWGLRVIKQKIWVKGTAYELQEIYGMEQKGANGTTADGYEDVDGNECVICMSAPRDTTALPCRHMCMCHACASALKTQTNKCPICRNEIESLLHIKINSKPAAGAGVTATS